MARHLPSAFASLPFFPVLILNCFPNLRANKKAYSNKANTTKMRHKRSHISRAVRYRVWNYTSPALPCHDFFIKCWKFTHNGASVSLVVADVNQHEEYGDQQSHSARNHLDRNQEPDEWSRCQQTGWKESVHEEWSGTSDQVNGEAA